jgi:hypothetical protein
MEKGSALKLHDAEWITKYIGENITAIFDQTKDDLWRTFEKEAALLFINLCKLPTLSLKNICQKNSCK